MYPVRELLSLALCVFVILSLGCEKPEGIARFELPKLKPSESESDAVDRMLVGIAFDGEDGLYFKLVGAKDEVASHEQVFLDFLRSVTFKEGRIPDWTVPDGWDERPLSNSIRIGTFMLGEEKKLELSITRMPVIGDSMNHLAENIDRWRKQMGLGRSTSKTRSRNLRDLQEANEEFLVLDIFGKFSGGMSGAPFAGGKPPLMPNHPPIGTGGSAGADKGREPVDYVAASHWKKTRLAMTPVAFIAEQGDLKATISISPMPKANTWESTLPIWKSSVKSTLTDQELEKHTASVEIMGREGKIVTIEQPADAKDRQALVAAMMVDGDTAWFFKLKGDYEVVEAEKANFDAFLKSIKLKQDVDQADPDKTPVPN